MKKTFFATILFLSVFFISVQPSFAAENQNFFQRIQSSISNTTQRLYLMLPGDKPGIAVLNQAAQAFPRLQSEYMSTDIAVDIQKENQSLGNVKFHADGPVKINQPSNQQEQHLTGSFTMQGTTMLADANVKATEKKIYLKLNEVPVLPYINLVDLKGRWLSFETSPTKTTPNTWTDAQKQEFQDANMVLIKNSEVSSAQKATKDDHAVYVVNITIPKPALVEYIDAVQKIQAQNPTDETTPAPDTTSSRAAIQKILDSVSEVKATLWIDRGNFFVRHFELPLVYTKPADVVESAVSESNPFANLTQFQTLKLSLVMNFDQFNAPAVFEEPTDAEDGQQVLQRFVNPGAMSGTAPLKTAPTVNPSELPNLTPQQRMQLEQYSKMQQIPGR
jgi:hypothetical protein